LKRLCTSQPKRNKPAGSMFSIARLFSYTRALEGQLAHERADRRRERRQLEIRHQREIDYLTKQLDEERTDRRIRESRIAHRGGGLPVFEPQAERNPQSATVQNRSRIEATVEKGKKQAEQLYTDLKQEISQHIQETGAASG
jgi:hypothetical protein